MDCCAHEGPDGGDARFDIQQVADGVHVAVAAPAYKVNCNTAIIETDDGLIVVDTHSKPSAARVIVDHLRDLSRAARALRRQHPLSLGPLARQRGLSQGVSGRRDRDQPDHARGHGEEGAEAHSGPRPPGPGRDRAARDRARRRAGPGGAHPGRRARCAWRAPTSARSRRSSPRCPPSPSKAR